MSEQNRPHDLSEQNRSHELSEQNRLKEFSKKNLEKNIEILCDIFDFDRIRSRWDIKLNF